MNWGADGDYTNYTRCSECNHPDYEHEEQRPEKGNLCSFGWCPCSLLRAQVQRSGERVTRAQIRPAYNHATGKWAS